MPKLSMGGKVKHYPYTPDGKLAYERDKARLKVSPGMQDADSGTYTPPKPTRKYSSRITYANTPKPSKTKPKQRMAKRKSSNSGLGTDGLEGFKSAGERIAQRRKTKQRTRSKY
jgi:hypothetical protein